MILLVRQCLINIFQERVLYHYLSRGGGEGERGGGGGGGGVRRAGLTA